MMPLYKAKTIKGDMLLSPFEIFIYLPENEIKEQEENLKRVWGELDEVSSLFDLRFILKENLIDNDPYMERVFEHSNIFARILMPRMDNKIGIEIGWIDANTSQEDVLKGELLRFVYQLCIRGLEQVEQMKIDTEFLVRESQERNERLFFIAELERRLVGITEEINRQLRRGQRSHIAYNRRLSSLINPDYLADDFEANKQKLGCKAMEQISIQELAALVGFDVPNFNDCKVDDKTSIFYDSSVSVTVCNFIPGSRGRLPGLKIGIEEKVINVPSSGREGIFAYVCTLIRYINGQSFGKGDIKEFKQKLKRHLTLSQKSPSFYRDIEIDKLPPLISREYHWFKNIYKALFYIRSHSVKDYNDQYDYITRMTFEQWCIHVIYDDITDPFTQGISNERSAIKKTLTEQGYGAIVNQVGAMNRDDKYYLNIDPEKIHFPVNDELWEKALNFAKDFDSTLTE